MPLRNRLPECYALCTHPYGIRNILDIRAVDILAIFGEDRGPDAELGVRAVGCGFRGRAAGVQGVELSCGYGVGLAGLGDVRFIGGLKKGCRHIERKCRREAGKSGGMQEVM
jgi:hypothetical protein